MLFCKVMGKVVFLYFQNETMAPISNKYDYLEGNESEQSGRDGNADKPFVNPSSHRVSTLQSGNILYHLKIKLKTYP